jgi:hypothetical protein
VDPALADAIHADTLPAGAIPAVPSHPPARPPIPALLAEHLAGCALHRATGVLRVTGEPGGAVHLTDGQVTAISTPGAPDPEVILLRSGRIGETGWSQVFASAAAHGRMPDELVKRGLIGAGELESLLRMALADAMFALAAGHVEECVLEQDAEPHLLPLQPAAPTAWLLAEARRRVEVLAGLRGKIAPDRDRVTSVQGAWTPVAGPGDGQAEILALANGRRTARDIAFVLGRGVFAVTLQLARMCDAGVLMVGSTRSTASRRGAGAASAPAVTGAEADGQDSAGASRALPPLPRRRRSTGQPAARPPERGSVLRMLRPGSGAHRQPDRQAGSRRAEGGGRTTDGEGREGP